jgi:hypothetical protein
MFIASTWARPSFGDLGSWAAADSTSPEITDGAAAPAPAGTCPSTSPADAAAAIVSARRGVTLSSPPYTRAGGSPKP